MGFKLRDLVGYWQEVAYMDGDEDATPEAMRAKLEKLYDSLGGYAELMPDVAMPAPAESGDWAEMGGDRP